MIIDKYMKYENPNFILLFILLLGLISSCQDESSAIFTENTTGRLVLGLSLESEVEDLSTRGTIVAPELHEITILITNKKTNEQTIFTDNQTEAILDIGNYIIEAIYGENVCGYSPYFYGKAEFTIATKQTTNVGVVVSLASTIIHPVVSSDLLLHYTSHQITISNVTDEYIIDNDVDYFVPANVSYVLKLSGTNALGENNVSSWTLNSVLSKTRYTINCNADLPSFNLPHQTALNAWSKFIYITPMSASDMISHADMADKVISNIVYEASADGANWFPSIYESGQWVIKNLEPSTTYTIRSRFGEVVSSNTQTLITESAQQLSHGNIETWTENKLYSGNGTYSGAIYCDYATGWATRNEKTTSGASSATGSLINGNYGVNWRWCSNTVPTSDCSQGSYAAEISTMAFYNAKVKGAWSRDEVLSYTKNNGTVYTGYLFLGTYTASNDSYTLGVSHATRPVSVSFDYKYSPLDNDNYTVSALVYDENKNVIATIGDFKSGVTQTSYQTQTLAFSYSNLNTSAHYISVFFTSGTSTDISNMYLVHGSYSVTPFVRDRVVGSVLKVDNVVLNYE